MTKGRRKKNGFTLIELMIVVLIMGVLAAMAIPRFIQASTKSKQSEAKGILKQVYTMQRTWRQDHSSYSSSFNSLGVEIPKFGTTARYSYAITTATSIAFTVTAVAPNPGLDDDPTTDEWRIDTDGNLWCQVDDVSS